MICWESLLSYSYIWSCQVSWFIIKRFKTVNLKLLRVGLICHILMLNTLVYKVLPWTGLSKNNKLVTTNFLSLTHAYLNIVVLLLHILALYSDFMFFSLYYPVSSTSKFKVTPSVPNYKPLWLFWYIDFAMYLDIYYI